MQTVTETVMVITTSIIYDYFDKLHYLAYYRDINVINKYVKKFVDDGNFEENVRNIDKIK
jgi:hypothetical protein